MFVVFMFMNVIFLMWALWWETIIYMWEQKQNKKLKRNNEPWNMEMQQLK